MNGGTEELTQEGDGRRRRSWRTSVVAERAEGRRSSGEAERPGRLGRGSGVRVSVIREGGFGQVSF
jgi:hypothetical protein